MMRLKRELKVHIPLALGLSLLSVYSAILPSSAEVAAPTISSLSVDTASEKSATVLAIKNIYLNDSKELVIEFDNPSHIIPNSPQVRDYPGQPHSIVLEFTQTSFAVDKAPKAKALLDELMKVYPGLNSIAYATANDGNNARIRIGVAPSLDTHPTLINIAEGSAVINLGLPTGTTSSTSPDIAATPSANEDSTIVTVPNNTKVSASNANTKDDKQANVATKTVKGIKGAWLSSLKVGHNQVSKIGQIAKLSDKVNPLGKLGHANRANNLSTPANSGIDTNVAEVKEAQTSPPNPSTEPTNIANTELTNSPLRLTELKPEINSSETKNTDTVTNASIAQTSPADPVANTPVAQTSLVAPVVSVATETATPTKASAAEVIATIPVSVEQTAAPGLSKVSQAEITAAMAGINEPISNSETKNVSQIEPKTVAPAQTETNSTVNKTHLELPRIGTTMPVSENTSAEAENLITPLSVDQVLKETVQPLKTVNKPAESVNAGQAGTSETNSEASSEKSVIADIKSDFSAKTQEREATEETQSKEVKLEALTVDKKDENTNIASAQTSSLDSLTSAAIKNESETPDKKTTATVAPQENESSKTQKAKIAGKDYLPPKFSDDAVDHYNKAVRFHLEGKLTEAAAEYQAACKSDSQIAEAYSNLGLIYNQQRKYDQAMVEFHKALVINPKDAITYNGIGAAMRAKNNMVAAIKNWKTALALDPNLASAHYNLGTAYELEKDMEQALVEYKEAVKHDDKLGEAYYRMGLILQKMNNKHLALEEYKHAIKVSQQANYATDAKRRINLLSQSKNSSM